jgi:hypothetical protein
VAKIIADVSLLLIVERIWMRDTKTEKEVKS